MKKDIKKIIKTLLKITKSEAIEVLNKKIIIQKNKKSVSIYASSFFLVIKIELYQNIDPFFTIFQNIINEKYNTSFNLVRLLQNNNTISLKVEKKAISLKIEEGNISERINGLILADGNKNLLFDMIKPKELIIISELLNGLKIDEIESCFKDNIGNTIFNTEQYIITLIYALKKGENQDEK